MLDIYLISNNFRAIVSISSWDISTIYQRQKLIFFGEINPREITFAKSVTKSFEKIMVWEIKIQLVYILSNDYFLFTIRIILLKNYGTSQNNASWKSRLETRSSILNAFKNQESSFEAWVSSIEFETLK